MSNDTLVFLKYPHPGQVKTKLAQHLGADGAAEMYRSFAMDIVDTVQKSGTRIRVCYHPSDEREHFVQWLGDKPTFIPQRGNHLGERLQGCFRRAFDNGALRAVVLGGDSPEISVAILSQAFERLSDHDCVIGPCYDGGYYLLGFRSDTFLTEAFEGIPWSTSKVFDTTMNILEHNGRTCFLLEKLHDVDTTDDLAQLVERCAQGALCGPRTRAYLKSLQS